MTRGLRTLMIAVLVGSAPCLALAQTPAPRPAPVPQPVPASPPVAPAPAALPVPTTPPAPIVSMRNGDANISLGGPLIPLKVQIVMSRYDGDKKISSLPYALSVNANDRTPSILRMGAQVPVPQMNAPEAPAGQPNPWVGPYVYKDIGTAIDCSARSMENGLFRLNISIEDSSVYADGSNQNQARRPTSPPAIRSFKLSNSAILKDGQTTQFSTATDKLSGEVTRIDVTLTVVK